MEITSYAALWFLPFALPLCAYTIYTDLAFMRITNVTVIALAAVFVLIGPIALPFDSYLWHLLAMVVALVVGIFMNAGGLMGAGDAKFIAAATPFIALGDVRFVMSLFMAALVVRLYHSPRRQIFPPAQACPAMGQLARSQEIPHGPRPWNCACRIFNARCLLRGLISPYSTATPWGTPVSP